MQLTLSNLIKVDLIYLVMSLTVAMPSIDLVLCTSMVILFFSLEILYWMHYKIYIICEFIVGSNSEITGKYRTEVCRW